jgi:hypothetical protein
MVKPLIPFRTLEPLYLTVQEYEKIQNTVVARILADDRTPAETVLAKMLLENAPRYHEAKRLEDEKRKP